MYRTSLIMLTVATLTACLENSAPNPDVAKVSSALEGPALVSVPATFAVGEDAGIRVIAFPHLFAIDETEVTVSQYEECVDDGGACSAPATDTDCNWGVSGKENHPVNCVTYTQAATYCAWAGKRLPTQQEWEYAARYPDGRTYPWGSSTSGYSTKTNTNSGDSYTLTAPVGSFPDGDSALGLQDMSGNVYEWTQSPECFNETGSCTNCPAGETCANACDVCMSSDRTMKGGSYIHALSNSRSAFRTYNSQSYANPVLGFRCVLSE